MKIENAFLQGRIEQLEGRIYKWEHILTDAEKEELEPEGRWDYEYDVEELEELRKEVKRG